MLLPTPRAVALLVAGALTAVVAYWTLQQVLLVPAVLMLAVPVIGLVTLIPAIRSKGASITVPNDLREGHGGWVEVQAPEAFTDAQYRWKSLASGFRVAWARLDGRSGSFLTGDLRRGVHELAGVQVRVTDVFGTWRWQPRVGGSHRIAVGPVTVPLDEALRSGFGASEAARLTGVTDQMDQLIRDHRREDGVRRIHWRQSAKRDRLVVRKEEPPAAGRAVVIVDTSKAGYADDDEFDAAMRTFISLAGLLRRAGTEVTYAETTEAQLPAQAARFSDRQLARALAGVATQDAEARMPSRGRMSAHVVCGARPSQPVAEYIATLGRRDTVWGADHAVVERGTAARLPLIRSEDDYLSELFA